MDFRYGVDDDPARRLEEMGSPPVIPLPIERMAGMMPEVDPPAVPRPTPQFAESSEPPMVRPPAGQPVTAIPEVGRVGNAEYAAEQLQSGNRPLMGPPPSVALPVAQPPNLAAIPDARGVPGEIPAVTATPALTGRDAFTPQPPMRTPGQGWKGRLASIGKGLLYGAGMGAQQGGAGAIGGAIAGAITGGVSPRAVARYEHKNIDLPEWERVRAREEGEYRQGQQEENVRRDDDRANEALRQQAAIHDADRTQRGDIAKTNREERAYQTWLQHGNPNTPLSRPEAIRMGRPELEGKKPPPKEFAPKTPHFDQTGKAVWDGTKWVKAPGSEVIPDKPDAGAAGREQAERHFQTNQGRQDQKDAEARQEKADGALKKFEDAKTDSEAAATEYSQTLDAYQRQRKDGLYDKENPVDDAQLAKLKAKAKAAKKAMEDAHRALGSYSDQFETGFQEVKDDKGNVVDRHPYAKPKANAPRGRGATAAGGSRPKDKDSLGLF